MIVLTIAFFSFLFRTTESINESFQSRCEMNASEQSLTSILIDSTDHVIIGLDLLTFDGIYFEIPVFIESDEVINTLDFSFLINVANVEFDSVIDYTGELQYAAFLNPNDLKLRFTSNSFSSYPVLPERVVSLRFKALSGVVHRSDFQMIVSYLNGEKCSNSLQSDSEDILLANDDVHAETINIHPNPASNMLIITTAEEGIMDLFDARGIALIYNHPVHRDSQNILDVEALPRGLYTIRISHGKHILTTQKVILQ